MGHSPKPPKEDPSTIALRNQQIEDLAQLSEDENRRIKKLLFSGRYGARGFAGAPMFRARPSDTAGKAAIRTPGGAGAAGTGSLIARAAGRIGGLYNGGGARRGTVIP